MFVVVVRRFVLVSFVVLSGASCVVSPTKPSEPPPPVQSAPCTVKAWACTSTFGAISYARGGSWGLAYNYSTQSAANAEAQRQCPSSSCSVVAQWSNSCGAIATSSDGAAGWATSTTGEFAQAQALLQCER